MNFDGLSTRSKALYWLYGLVLSIGVAFVLAVLISLGGYYILGWESAPVSEIAGRLVAWAFYSFVPLLALRFGVRWSIKRDRSEH